MNPSAPCLDAVFCDIDRANADDPRRIRLEGKDHAYEALYAKRMSARLAQLYPDAGALLQIAARAQHIRRWDIPRARYPEGRQGYETWRRACRAHHVALLTPILRSHGYGTEEIAQIAKLIRKEGLKKDPDSQALENVVAVVFVEHYIEEFLAKYPGLAEDKRVGIIAKTLRKMSAPGHEAVLALELAPEIRRLIEAALASMR